MSDLFDAVRHISAREAAERAGIPLQMRGGKAWACCPIHGERTPSLRLYEDAERGWYCFGCHRGGDAIKLYEALYHLSPLEAAKALAAAFNIPTDGPAPKPAPTAYNLWRALERFRAGRLAALREARRLADGVCRCRAVADGAGGAWADPAFVQALMARAEADVWIDRFEGASLESLAVWYSEGCLDE